VAEGPAADRRREIMDAFEGLKQRTHFEVLDLKRGATDAQVKDAYFRLARRFHPDVHHDASLADLRDKLEAVFIRLGEAYEVLKNPRTRASYEERLGSVGFVPGAPPPPEPPAPPPDPAEELRKAQEAIRIGEKLYEKEKFWDAIQVLEPAVPIVTGRMKQRGTWPRPLLPEEPELGQAGGRAASGGRPRGPEERGRPFHPGDDLQGPRPARTRPVHVPQGGGAEAGPRGGSSAPGGGRSPGATAEEGTGGLISRFFKKA